MVGLKTHFCSIHKQPGMVNVKSSKCQFEGCIVIPSFNVPGETQGIFCSEHKHPNMINVKSPICQFEGCIVIPSFNVPGETQGIFCAEHKHPNMVDVKSPICQFEGCNVQSIFNVIGEKRGIFCAEHKHPNMVDVKNSTCQFEGCIVIPSFNVPRETQGIFCSEHKHPNMINVKSPICQFEGCNVQSIFNILGEKRGLFCAEHKQLGMINVTHLICKTPLCGIQVSSKYKGYCLRCYVNNPDFQNEPTVRNYKTKERAVFEFIDKNFGNKYTIRWDKRVVDGCSLRRPDFIVDFGDWVLIIEVDENKHQDYDCSCENKRICELSQDIGHRPMVIIRFNPDDYINLKNEKVTSCWGYDKRGIAIVKKSKMKEWDYRLNCLNERIEYWILNPTDKTIQVDPLFFDGC